VWLGVVSIAHELPFQRSASVNSAPEPLEYLPTAVHSLATVHDTPLRELPLDPVGLGVAWIAQAVPFQRSARVRPSPCPTAIHAFAALHATARRTLPVDPVGVAWIVHELPFQCSARVPELKL